MATIREMLNKWKAFNIDEELGAVVNENKEAIIEQNKKQLLEGRGSDGNLLTPNYTDDPWFKSQQGAINYAQWKQQEFPNPLRPVDTPNLTVKNVFHNAINITISGNKILYTDNAAFAAAVIAKYRTALGLNSDSRIVIWRTVARVPFVQRLALKTGTTYR